MAPSAWGIPVRHRCSITLPAAYPDSTGLLGIAQQGKQLPIFTALFSPFWSDLPPEGIRSIATLSVMIYNFAIMPYEFHNELAWAASFVLVVMILALNPFSLAGALLPNKPIKQ